MLCFTENRRTKLQSSSYVRWIKRLPIHRSSQNELGVYLGIDAKSTRMRRIVLPYCLPALIDLSLRPRINTSYHATEKTQQPTSKAETAAMGCAT